MSSLLLNILILVFLIGINAFFAMSEIAILSTNNIKMKKFAEEGDKKAALLLRITEDPSDFLSTIQVGVTLSGFFASAVAADKFTGYFMKWLQFLPIPQNVLSTIVLVLITLILSYFTLVFGELVPKRVAMKNTDKLALFSARIIWGVYRFSKPFVLLLSASTNLVLRLLGINPHENEETVTEDEIMLMVESAEASGIFEDDEKQLIQNIFALDDMHVAEVMTHRMEMVWIEPHTTIFELASSDIAQVYSRIPVCEGSADNVLGIVYVKDILPLLHSGNNIPVRDIMHEATFVSEKAECAALLRRFRDEKIHLALVVDEFGATQGLVSLEDLLEAIVGDIEDEYDIDDDADIELLFDGTYILKGDALFDDVANILHLQVTTQDKDYTTIAGYLISALGHIPSVGETFLSNGGTILFTILEATERKIIKIKAEKLPLPQA